MRPEPFTCRFTFTEMDGQPGGQSPGVEKEDKNMKGTVRETMVGGQIYKVWSDFILRGTYAEDEAGNVQRIYGGGYLSNDLSIRKAIANKFGLPTFRK